MKHRILRWVILVLFLKLFFIGLISRSHAQPAEAGAAQTSTTPSASAPVTLRIISPPGTSPEGETAVVRLEREVAMGNLDVRVLIGGKATLGTDYLLEGVETLDEMAFNLNFADGEASLELVIDILSDSAAEADETIVLKLESNELYSVAADAGIVTLTIPRNDFMVTSTADQGQGSLRQAILNANAIDGPDTITFDPRLFAEPQTITLASELPALATELTIDGYIADRLWAASGVTVDGNYRHRVFRVSDGTNVAISFLTVAGGFATQGGGIANSGTLVVKGVTFLANSAAETGGGVVNLGGTITLINSTFAHNAAGDGGGGLFNAGGTAVVTNCTFSDNRARRGGALFNQGELTLRNTILANSDDGRDCAAHGVTSASTHNLIESNNGCGLAISSEDPRLQPLAYFNGPTKTYALLGGSVAINFGDNASAVDEHGEPLVWDQRGSGDPRFVAGYTDIGAFEHQRLPVLTVDTVEDSPLRGCTPAGKNDCPLRGAIELADATDRPDVIEFDPRVFTEPQAIVLRRPLPEVGTDITLDAAGTGGVAVLVGNGARILEITPNQTVQLRKAGVDKLGAQSAANSPSNETPARATE